VNAYNLKDWPFGKGIWDDTDPYDETDEEKNRCLRVWEACRKYCSDILPGDQCDQGNEFQNCVNECLDDHNCLGKLHSAY
jgi:hypothetical protein